MKKSSIRKYIVGDMPEKMGPTNAPYLGLQAVTQNENSTVLVNMLPRTPHTPREPKIIKLKSFEGSRGLPLELTIPLIEP